MLARLMKADVADRIVPWLMGDVDKVQYAKTANRSFVGIHNEFVRQAEFWLAAYAYEMNDDDDLLAISAKLAETPCSPLYKGPISPDKALQEVVNAGAQA